MMFCGLDVSVGDTIVAELLDEKTLVQYKVVGDVTEIIKSHYSSAIVVLEGNNTTVLNARRVIRIAFLNDENTPLLIDI